MIVILVPLPLKQRFTKERERERERERISKTSDEEKEKKMIELSGGDWFGQEVNEPGTGTSTYVGQEYTPIGPGVIHWTLKEPPCNGQF
jgi:hypothetical protein